MKAFHTRTNLCKALAVILSLVMVTAAFIITPVRAEAASNSNNYDDVGKKTHGSSEIYTLRTYGAWDGIVTGKKFKPDKVMTIGESITVLRNLYGDTNVTCSRTEKAEWKDEVTVKWFCNKLSEVMENRNTPLGEWSNMPKCTLKRYNCAKILVSVINMGERYKPSKDDDNPPTDPGNNVKPNPGEVNPTKPGDTTPTKPTGPYSDINEKTAGYEQIIRLDKLNAWEYIVSGGKFEPDKSMTKGEVILVLTSLYSGDTVPISTEDSNEWYNTASIEWSCNKISELMYNRGTPLGAWENLSTKDMKRYNLAKILCAVADLGGEYGTKKR